MVQQIKNVQLGHSVFGSTCSISNKKSALSSEPPRKKEGTRIFTTYLSYDVITAGVMFILLAIAAWSDNYGAEVSDVITVPYAVFGCYATFLHERWVTACICVLCLLSVLVGVQIPY